MTVSSGPGESCRHDSISLTNVRQTFNKACYHRCRPRWHNGKEHAYQCRRHKRRVFHSWVGKIPWRRKWQPIPAFLPENPQGQRSLAATVQYRAWQKVREDGGTDTRLCPHPPTLPARHTASDPRRRSKPSVCSGCRGQVQPWSRWVFT